MNRLIYFQTDTTKKRGTYILPALQGYHAYHAKQVIPRRYGRSLTYSLRDITHH